MKKLCFQNNSDGFYGTYYPNPKGAKHAMIGLFGDDPNDFMAKCGAKWLHKNGVNVLCMSPDVKNYSHVNYPLERIETAIQWLKSHGNQKIGIMGMSTAGMDSLAAASYFPDITLTFGLTASDFIWQGFEQGEKDGCKEWPESTSTPCTIKKSKRKQKVREILPAAPACLSTPKKQESIRKKK